MKQESQILETTLNSLKMQFQTWYSLHLCTSYYGLSCSVFCTKWSVRNAVDFKHRVGWNSSSYYTCLLTLLIILEHLYFNFVEERFSSLYEKIWHSQPVVKMTHLSLGCLSNFASENIYNYDISWSLCSFQCVNCTFMDNFPCSLTCMSWLWSTVIFTEVKFW